MNNKKILLIGLVSLTLFSVIGYIAFATYNKAVPKPVDTSETRESPPSNTLPEKLPDNIQVATPKPQPVSVLIDVPFTSQSPFAIWDEVGENACEEASVIMASWFANNKTGSKQNGYKNLIRPETAQAEILTLVEWQKSVLGEWESTNTKAVMRILSEHENLNNIQVLTDISIVSIKKELASGNIVLLPAAGRELKNPNFKQPGPPYHYLLVRGYTSKEFITNDPGTRKGEEYKYPYDVLINAVHDWNGSDETILEGKKVGIVIGKNK